MAARELAAKRVVVCGAGYTGQAIARVLKRLGKDVTVTDDRPAAGLESAARVLAELEVALHPGGHDAEVIGRGEIVVISPGVAPSLPALQQARANGVPVWGELELASRLADTRLIGITGTKGKTTTAALVSRMLDVPLANAEAWSARGVPLIELVVDNPELELAVVEMSSYQLEGIDQLAPWVATLLNVGDDHKERHPTKEEYAAAKARIFMNQGPSERSVYSHDDPTVRAIGETLSSLTASFSLGEGPEHGVWATDAGIELRLPTAVGGLAGRLLDWSDVTPAMRLQKPSLLAASLTALMADGDIARVRQVAREFEGLPHRLEFIRNWRELTFINDSKGTNPLATENALRLSPRPVVLIAGGITKGADLTPLVEPFGRLHALILIGQDADLLAEAGKKAKVRDIRRAADLRAAVHEAIDAAAPDDWIILSPCGASFDMFENFADRGDQFRAIVEALA